MKCFIIPMTRATHHPATHQSLLPTRDSPPRASPYATAAAAGTSGATPQPAASTANSGDNTRW